MRKLVLYGVIIFQVLLIISLVRGIQISRQSSVRIDRLSEIRQKLEAEQEALKEEMKYVQSPLYLEKVARDELRLSKPGETVVIVPDEFRAVDPESRRGEDAGEKANWQKWWEVLSGKM